MICQSLLNFFLNSNTSIIESDKSLKKTFFEVITSKSFIYIDNLPIISHKFLQTYCCNDREHFPISQPVYFAFLSPGYISYHVFHGNMLDYQLSRIKKFTSKKPDFIKALNVWLLFFAVYVIYKRNYSFSRVVFLFFQTKIAKSFYSKINDSGRLRTIKFSSRRFAVRVTALPKIFTIYP